MRHKFLPVTCVALLAAMLLTGCGSEPTRISANLPPPPAADLGPEFEVVKTPNASYWVNGVMDATGRAHLIVARRGEVFHLVIGAQGVESIETIRTGGLLLPNAVDLAFDRSGVLHALVDDEHLVKKDGIWIGGQRTPWMEARIKPDLDYLEGLGFVKGTPDLTWFFRMSASDMGLPWASGGVGNLLGLPQDHTRPVIVQEETPYRHWYAPDFEANDSVYLSYVVGDKQNMLYVLDTVSYYNSVSYGFVRMGGACPDSDVMSRYGNDKRVFKLGNSTLVCPLSGINLDKYLSGYTKVGSYKFEEPKYGLFNDDVLAAAIDADAPTLLWVGKHGISLYVDFQARQKVPNELPITNVNLILETAGKGRFHALATGRGIKRDGGAPIYYLENDHGNWSAPVEIGGYSYGFTLIANKNVLWSGRFKIITNNHGRALLLWPKEDALVARWVTLK